MFRLLMTAFWTLVLVGLIAAGLAAGIVNFGVYNVAATQQHSSILYHLLHYAMTRSVRAHSGEVKVVDDLNDTGRIRAGMVLYRAHCQQCHGGPGAAPDPLGLGLRPEPVNLDRSAREWEPNEIYWVIRHGLKMTAMPSWEYRMSDEDLWNLTAFVHYLPKLSPPTYLQWAQEADRQLAVKPGLAWQGPGVGANRGNPSAAALTPGDAQRGRHVMEQYMCITCHSIPGVTGADQAVGPPLKGIAKRAYIGGVLPNTPDNMMKWLRDPQQVAPASGMPNLHIREQDLRDITAYLYTLDRP